MTNKVGVLLLGLLGISPLFLLPRIEGALAVVFFLPFFFGVGLPVSRSFLGLDARDALFVPISIVNGIVCAGTAHLLLLHVSGRAVTPYLLVVAGALLIWAYRRDLFWILPEANPGKVLLVAALLYPQLARVHLRAWGRLVAPDGGVVNFFNNTQSFNAGMIWDVAGGIPVKSSFIYPLVGTYHVGGHALIDMFRLLGNLTPFEANFIVVNLFVVGLGEVVLLWLISRWFCESVWGRLLFLGAVVYLSGEALRVFLVRNKLIGDTWVFGGDEAEMFAFPYINPNVPRMASLLLVLWLVYVIFERVRQNRPAGLPWAIVLGILLGSLYYYKNSAFVAFLPGFALAAGYRAWRERQLDLCVMLGMGVVVGLAIHRVVFSYGGSYGVGVPLQLIRSWGVEGSSLGIALLAYLMGWNFRALGAMALVVGRQEIRSNRVLVFAGLLLLGTLGAGMFLANFLTHSVAPDLSAPSDSRFHRFYAPAEGGYSVYNRPLRQFIHIPHAFVSIFLLGFLVRWIEGGVRGGKWMGWMVGILLCVSILGGMSVARQAFAYHQKPAIADADLRAALVAIPKERSWAVANFLNYSVVSLQGHRFYHQFTAFFNYGSLRDVLHERVNNQYRLFSAGTEPSERRRILEAMEVTHVLIKKDAGGITDTPGCVIYYENSRYRVCRTGM